jgi:hypothetical protein
VAGAAELQDALLELDMYLSDRIAPLMVADSIAVLIQYPARLLASEIGSWADRQRAGVGDASIADFLYHAVKKVSLIGEFDLVPKDALARYLVDLCASVLEFCPEGTRELLRQNLDRLGHSPANPFATPLEVLHRLSEKTGAQTQRKQVPEEELPRDVALGLRRLGLLLERLQLQSIVAAPADQRSEVASQFMTAAAVQSSSQKELDEYLAPLRQVGIETSVDKVLRALAQNVPGWGRLPTPAEGAEAPRGPLKAMHQIVSLAEDPAEGGKRFRELVHAAIEEFNGGHLGRAVTMFELAEQLVTEEKVKPVFVEALKNGGHEFLKVERLRQLAERADAHSGLSTILQFFWALQPAGLLKALNGEPRRERRHELLALLEVHGPATRATALEMLQASVEDPYAGVDPFFQMNLVYLLRVIAPPGGNVPSDDEMDLVTRVPGRASPPPLAKQVIAYLAHFRHEKTERALIAYLRLFESMLLQPETAVYESQDVEVLLERTCAALARHGAPRAWRALVDHGLNKEPSLGSTLARLVEVGRQDLSKSKDLVERLIDALRAELPRTVLGLAVKKVNEDRIVWLIRALSGTPLPEVQATFREIVDKHRAQPFAEAASKGLAGLNAGAKPETPAGISGDLDLFGLPGLLQTLGQQQLTGVLNLLNGAGKPEATMLFERGRLRGASYGGIRGEDACYQLFERPFPGTFAFVSRQDLASQGPLLEPVDVLGLILEGVRRHDEFKRAAALVPDGVTLRPTGAPSTPLSDEDEDFVRLVWTRTSSAATPVECEAGIATDAYRVRRLLAHWFEEGSLAAG